MSDSRTKVRAHATARAAQTRKALEGQIETQRKLLRDWLHFFEHYCTDANTGKLAQDTKEAIR